MAYFSKPTPRTANLVAQPLHTDLSGIVDDIVSGVKSAGKAALNFYNSSQQAQGAQQAYQSMQPAPMAPAGGISTQTVLLLGGGALALYFLLK